MKSFGSFFLGLRVQQRGPTILIASSPLQECSPLPPKYSKKEKNIPLEVLGEQKLAVSILDGVIPYFCPRRQGESLFVFSSANCRLLHSSPSRAMACNVVGIFLSGGKSRQTPFRPLARSPALPICDGILSDCIPNQILAQQHARLLGSEAGRLTLCWDSMS